MVSIFAIGVQPFAPFVPPSTAVLKSWSLSKYSQAKVPVVGVAFVLPVSSPFPSVVIVVFCPTSTRSTSAEPSMVMRFVALMTGSTGQEVPKTLSSASFTITRINASTYSSCIL